MSIYVADVAIRSLFDDKVVQDWAILKSIVFTLSSFAAMGLDQALVREPSKWKILKYSIITSVIVASTAGATLMYALGVYEHLIGLAAAIALIAMGNIIFGLLRTNAAFGLAFVARDGWKALFLIGVGVAYLIGTHRFDYIIVACALLPAAICMFIFRRRSQIYVPDLFNDMNDFRSALRVGAPFAFASMSLSIAIYSESALLSMFGNEHVVADYFVANICYISSIVMLNTFVTSVLVGYVRKNPERWVSFLRSGRVYFFATVLFAPLIAYPLGWVVNKILFESISISEKWAIVMSMTAGLRIVYTIIGTTVGSLGTKEDVTQTSVLYFLCAILFVGLAFLLNGHIADAGLAMALSTTLHWTARSLVGIGAVRRVMRRYGE